MGRQLSLLPAHDQLFGRLQVLCMLSGAANTVPEYATALHGDQHHRHSPLAGLTSGRPDVAGRRLNFAPARACATTGAAARLAARTSSSYSTICVWERSFVGAACAKLQLLPL